MGNAAPRAQPQSVLDSASQYRTFLMDYTPRSMDMMFGSLIGDGKFLKSISCKCDEGHLVVKIYRKYDDRESLTSAEVALRRLALAFSVEQQPNVIPYADFQLSNKYNVAFMVRQYFASNLYDRICSRPFLTMVEKKWIAFQILRALEQSHAKGICHGDIKQENVMVTSWNWVFLTDFAPFKPTYIPEDDPADYNYYFCAIDATRRGCSVAPERFYGKGPVSSAGASGSTPGSAVNSMKTPDAALMLSRMADSEVTVEEVDKQILAMGMGSGTMSGNPMQTPTSATSNGSAPSSYSRSRREGSLQESMDIFSAGCVIAELFLGGKPLFDLPSLLKYRTGDSEALRQQLKKVGDPRLEELLLHMLQLDPNARMSASNYLAKYTSPSGLFPTYFDNFLFRFLVLVLSRGGKVPDARIRLVCKYYGRLVREVAGVEDPEGEEFFKLRLKEGYGSDRLATATGGDQQTHVAQRVLEELDQRIPSKHDKQKAERDNAALTKLQKMKEKENDMRGLSNTLQKKKIEKLHDQFNALTQKKKNSLLLDYSREPSTGRLDEETISEDAESKDEDGLDISGSEPWPHDRNGIVIILSLICSSLRHVQVPESKLTALYLIRSLGQFTSDEARLQRLIPYLLEVIDDPSATVRALALRTITYLLSLVESFPLADASVFPHDGTVHVFRVDKVNAVGGNVQATGVKELRANNSAVMAIDYLNNVTEALLLYATRDGDGEVAVFDLSIGACRAVFRTLEAQASEAEACKCPTLLHVPIPHRSRTVLGSFLGIYGIATAFDEISTSTLSEEPSVRAMLCPSLHLRGIGDALITGGEDRQLRYWDIRNGKQSYTVCGNGEAKSFYDNQAPPNDWWRMNPSSSSSAASQHRFDEMPAAPVSTTSTITKPEMAWSKLSPPLITVCQDSSLYSTPGAGAAASGAGGVESAISMERRGLVPPSPAHTDCILDLTLVELGSSQNSCPMLVSSGRDALIKVWK
ncbi:Phosphoinositide 3-kinase regulatory subunit [Phytophthora megakarya]|uniref:non-specific serine/threonine protein kinase n=1 Tax=Phytophthora megakarya TaxID=4795 RepID=A0A225X0L1_9STRA|nr:Phosphoinositide 3-kinase regulatory subunit [Phytophthora megakarya]